MTAQPISCYSSRAYSSFMNTSDEAPFQLDGPLNQFSIIVTTASSPAPNSNRLILTNEGGLKKLNPSWELIKTVIYGLDPGQGNSFCVLENSNHDFVQTLHGFNGYHLEWHESISNRDGYYQQFRASYPGGSIKSFELKKHDSVSPGNHRDLLPVEEVIEAFHSFYTTGGKPDWMNWRLIDV